MARRGHRGSGASPNPDGYVVVIGQGGIDSGHNPRVLPSFSSSIRQLNECATFTRALLRHLQRSRRVADGTPGEVCGAERPRSLGWELEVEWTDTDSTNLRGYSGAARPGGA